MTPKKYPWKILLNPGKFFHLLVNLGHVRLSGGPVRLCVEDLTTISGLNQISLFGMNLPWYEIKDHFQGGTPPRKVTCNMTMEKQQFEDVSPNES